MEKLIVRNFGPIDNVEIEIKQLTIFIGENGTGKSILAKLIDIFKNSLFWYGEACKEETSLFMEGIAEFGLDSFLKDTTYIKWESDKSFTFDASKPNSIVYNKKHDYDENKCIIPTYIKSERNTQITNVGDNSLSDLYIEEFGIMIKYFGSYALVEAPDGNTFRLENASCGIKAIYDIVSTIDANKHFKIDLESDICYHYTIEEPELNLFPLSQKKLVNLLVKNILSTGDSLVLTTHSPYILTSLNNILFASLIEKEFPNSREKIIEETGVRYFVRSSDVAVYYMSFKKSPKDIVNPKTGIIGENDLDQTARDDMDTFYGLMDIYSKYSEISENLINETTGMISENELDSASDDIADEFDSLMSILRKSKRI
jgi:hypothetical protein